MVTLSANEKRKLCNSLAVHLPRIREMLGVTQAGLGELCGISRARVSQIESGHSPMRWAQWMGVMHLCAVNRRTRDYIAANELCPMRVYQYLQRLDENIPPDLDTADFHRYAGFQTELSRTKAKLDAFTGVRLSERT